MKGTYLGEFEELVLLTVGILYDDAYGLALVDELERQTGRQVMISSVHKVLVRLEDALQAAPEQPRDPEGERQPGLGASGLDGVDGLARDAEPSRQLLLRPVPLRTEGPNPIAHTIM